MALPMAERIYYINNAQCEGRYANILAILYFYLLGTSLYIIMMTLLCFMNSFFLTHFEIL